MKKLLVLICVLVLLFTSCNPTVESDNRAESTEQSTSQSVEQEADFRKAKWGMTQEEVKQSESATLFLENETSLFYEEVQILGFPTNIIYTFNDNKLINGGYYFSQEHSADNLYYEDYLKIVKSYTEKYGEPIEEKADWLDSLYKDNPEKWGYAVKHGHVRFITKWETDKIKIGIILNGDNNEFSLNVIYQPINSQSSINTDGI